MQIKNIQIKTKDKLKIKNNNFREEFLMTFKKFKVINVSCVNVCQALFKASDGDESKWSFHAHSMFCADHVTIHWWMGSGPYFAVTGAQPLLPLDFLEATYLHPLPSWFLTTMELIAEWTASLEKWEEDLAKLHSRVYSNRLEAAKCFEKEHSASIKDYRCQQQYVDWRKK